MRVAVTQPFLLLVGLSLSAQNSAFFNGGTERIEEGTLRAGSLIGTVYDSASTPIPGARVQVLGGATKRIFHDLRADSRGRFRLPQLPVGRYRMGVSSDRFHLHLWELEIVKNGVPRNLNVRLRAANTAATP